VNREKDVREWGVLVVYGKAELNQCLKRYLAVLEENIPIHKAILYGSYAYGDPHDWSDIDLVVLSPAFRGISYPERLERLAVLAWRAGVGDIEALGYTPEEFEEARDLSLLGEVREQGAVVYEKGDKLT
jgi:predicted nucleotidyltransferase